MGSRPTNGFSPRDPQPGHLCPAGVVTTDPKLASRMVQPRLSSPRHVPRNLAHQGPTDANWYKFGLGQGDSARPFGLGQSHPIAIEVGLGQGDSASKFGLGQGDSARPFGLGQSHPVAIEVGLGQGDSDRKSVV